MKDSWLDRVSDEDIVKYIWDAYAVKVVAINRISDNKTGMLHSIVATVLSVDVYLGIEQEEHEVILNPYSCDSLLKSAKVDEDVLWVQLLNRINKGKLINGITYQSAYKKYYTDRLENDFLNRKNLIIEAYKRDNQMLGKKTQQIFGDEEKIVELGVL